MGKLETASCAACEYYKPVQAGTEVLYHGECRRFPPAVIVDRGEVVGRFPSVDETDWCGDFSETEMSAAHSRDREAA